MTERLEGGFAWIHAWEAAMAEAGYPKARLEISLYDEGWSYSWLWDLDDFLNGEQQTGEAWSAAHMAFLLVDSLRPSWVIPSLMLQEMLEDS